MRHILPIAAAVFVSFAASQACTPSVDVFDADENGGCTEPRPPSEGWCPPAWTCIDGSWVDTAGACPDQCPAEQPEVGTACDIPDGQVCSYEETWEECGELESYWVKLICTNHLWTVVSNYCSPPPECPAELPVAGGDCTDWYDAYDCAYPVETGCGPASAWAWCEGSTWQVEMSVSCPSCADLGSAATCSADPACRWLVPGCGEGTAVIEGCYPADDCTDSCPEGEQCTTVIHNPCWNSPCDACGAEANVCQPAP